MSVFMIGEGLSLGQAQDRAKQTVIDAFVSLAERDGVPPTLRAAYVLKVAEARIVLGGGSSEYIATEAGYRGTDPQMLAQTIVGLSEQSMALELQRMQLNVAIEAAQSIVQVSAILAQVGLALSVPA